MTNFYIISYDIVDTKRRNLVSKCLENYGTRVQYSVFECLIDNQRFSLLHSELDKIIKKDEDSIRFYTLCSMCEKKISIIGQGEVTKDQDVYVV